MRLRGQMFPSVGTVPHDPAAIGRSRDLAMIANAVISHLVIPIHLQTDRLSIVGIEAFGR